jgi:hypothetical protein
MTIPKFPATFGDYFGCVLALQAWHGGVWGVPGAAGTAVEADIWRGWMQAATARRKFGADEVSFHFESSGAFLKAARFTRGMDYGAGARPQRADDLERSSRTCSNTTPTGPAGTRMGWATASTSPTTRSIAFSLSEGSVWDMLGQLANNWRWRGRSTAGAATTW